MELMRTVASFEFDHKTDVLGAVASPAGAPPPQQVVATARYLIGRSYADGLTSRFAPFVHLARIWCCEEL
jgi:hypothetical protein